ncbi:hypothetical protein C0Q70_01178 [Pomacea canaliculata]|uniref:Uncharacterized protein n=1 Tax=Pomacea canaliculata TaxID=400727 RepID=A0A2T7PYQ8_POMCA|nr:hypothetical protein C0Q70_01178 [Pomacea canaliculata]
MNKNLSEETDIYANSDYTDTVSSVDSHTFLLPEKRTEDDAEDDTADKKNSLTATAVASQDNAAFYKNPAFAEEFGTEHAENFIEFSSAPQGDLLNNVTINRCSDTCLESCIRHQCVEEVNAVSDLKERAYPSETAILVENTAVAELVELLKEQCPSECVDIQVQELHEPVYQPLTEPVDKQGWMNSTESLHQYKLLKQGRSHLEPGEHDHSSFRSLAAESLSSLSRACQVALVHIRTDMEFGSMLSIEDHAKCPDQDKGFLPSELESLKKEGQQKSGPAVQSGRHKRNMIFMSILSSINHEGGVGVTSLAAYFILYTLGSLVSPVVVKGLGVRLPVLVGLVVQLAHIGANLYPAMWLMVLSSGAGGFTVALMWNAMSTYIVLLARGEAEVKRLTYERVSDKYFGFFSFIFQFNLMVGSVISSLVLTFGNQAGAGTAAVALANMSISNLSDANVQHVIPPPHQESSVVSDETKYLLFGTFMLIIVVAFLIGAFLMEPLRPHLLSPSSAPLKMVKQQLVSLARFSRNPKFLLLTPMLLYFSMQFNFICSDVMMAYVTCPVGVHMVGYTMVCYGAMCSVSSYVNQALATRVRRSCFITIACALNASMLIFLRVWQPHPDTYVPLFIVTGLWGFADGIWNVQTNCLMASMFADHYEDAFTGFRVGQGLGGALVMSYSQFLCMAVKIYMMLAAVVVVFAGYVGAEVLIRRDRKKLQRPHENEYV